MAWSSPSRTNFLTAKSEGFFFSEEYLKKNVSDEEYVSDLYRAFMGREYDQGGLDYWLDKMNNGYTRDEVFAGFANSPEFERICANYGITRGTYSAKDIGIKKYIEIKKSEAPVGLEEFLSNFAWVVTYGDGYEEYNSETQQGIESLAIRFFGPVSELDIYDLLDDKINNKNIVLAHAMCPGGVLNKCNLTTLTFITSPFSRLVNSI